MTTKATASQPQASASNLAGRTLYVPRMTYVGARLFAAVFRSAGLDARVVDESDERTLELAGLHSDGEECYPLKVTLGDFLRIVEQDDFDPDKTAFFMPVAEGPCRFGQYAAHLQRVLESMGYAGIPVISPTSKNGYAGVADHAPDLFRRAWRSVVTADILRKCLLKTRPYETVAGAADEAFERSIERVETVLAAPQLSSRRRLAALTEALVICRDEFRDVPARYTRDRLLIGVVGEIFCRLCTFANDDAVRRIEAHGGEAWLSDTSEWVWYTNWSERDRLVREGKRIGLDRLVSIIKTKVQRADEHALLAPFGEDFRGYEEPHDVYQQVLRPAWPYLPADSALGEMVLTVGKSIYLHDKGADGIVDISPFSCMNGIVTEAVHPAVSRDYNEIPIRSFYFDATSSNMERDLDIFMELARDYHRRSGVRRVYPAYFS